MRFIVYGAGGVGGVIGAQLFLHGHDVVLIARGEHLQALQDKGLRYETPDGVSVLPVPAVGDPREIAFTGDDVVLLTMKSQHTLAALNALRSAAGDRVPVICAQNGIANEDMALRRFARVYAMLVYLPAVRLEPGVVVSHAAADKGVLDAGCYPSGTDALIGTVTGTLDASGFSAGPVADAMRWKYGKLIRNLGNAVQALCRNEADDAEPIEGLRQRLRAEAEACYAAAGIASSSLPEEEARRKGHMVRGEVPGRPAHRSSTWQSIARGTGDIEADYLNGEIVRLGRLHGVPVPANAVMQRLATALARERGAVQSMDPREILALIEAEVGTSG